MSKIELAENKFEGNSQFKKQETTEKTNEQVEEKIQETLDRSASNRRRRCSGGGSREDRDVPTEPTQEKYKKIPGKCTQGLRSAGG